MNQGILSFPQNVGGFPLPVKGGGTGTTSLGVSRQILLGNGTSPITAMAAPTTGDNNADAIVGTSSAVKKALVIQGAASQSVNVFEIQSSDGIARFAISLGSATATGPNNTNLGVNAGSALTLGSNNTNVGVNAGITETSGSHNTVVGSLADVNSAATANAVAVGDQAKAETGGISIGQGVQSAVTNDLNIRTGDTGIKRDGAAGVMGITDGSGNILTRFGRLNYQTKTSSYTLVQGDGWSHIAVDGGTAGAALAAITLPSAAAVGNGWTIWIEKSDGNAFSTSSNILFYTNPVAINCNSLDGIDGIPYTSKTLNTTPTFSITSNVVTINCNAHGLIMGSVFTITGAANTYINGTFVCTSATTNSFTFNLTHANVGNTNDSGTLIYATNWLCQQHSKIGLVSTGVSGSGAKQGWTVISVTGEYLYQAVSSASPPATGTYGDICGIVVPPGFYDLCGIVDYNVNTTTTHSASNQIGGGISSSSGNVAFTNGEQGAYVSVGTAFDGQGTNFNVSIPPYPTFQSVPQTWYLKSYATYTLLGNQFFVGRIMGRRTR